VLHLADGETAGDYDKRLLSLARQYGIYPAGADVKAPTATGTPPLHAKSQSSPVGPRSPSTDSEGSTSSSMTFDLSKRSDKAPSIDKPRALGAYRRGSTSSSSAQDHDSVLSNVRSSGPRSLNIRRPVTATPTDATVTASQSTDTLPAVRDAKQYPKHRLIRGISHLRLRRTDSDNSVKRFD